ncbi:MAG TPA: DUF6790 family protein [Xanthobacteraceae bacterium]|nr:DUF6790 family protein [Xanthobacteraceae bacterium]
MEGFIRTALTNFSVTMLVVALIAALIAYWSHPPPRSRAGLVEALFASYLLFAVGVGFLYNFVMHVFFGPFVAAFIGWQPSPFQAEVGFASLGFGVVGLIAARGSYGMRAAAVVGPSLFLLGAAAGHIHQMITAGNFAPGNAGSVFWTDILGPLIGFALLWLARPASKPAH